MAEIFVIELGLLDDLHVDFGDGTKRCRVDPLQVRGPVLKGRTVEDRTAPMASCASLSDRLV